MPKNWMQKIGVVIGHVIFYFTLFFCLWQLDLLMSQFIWSDPTVYNHLWTINLELFPNMTRGLAYDVLFALMAIGASFGFELTFLSVWLWDN